MQVNKQIKYFAQLKTDEDAPEPLSDTEDLNL